MAVDKPLVRWSIWLWMYMGNVAPDQRPCFWIVVSVIPCNFIAIDPPPQRECKSTSSHEIPLFSILRLPFCSLHQCSHLIRGDFGPNSLSRHLVTEEVFFISTIIQNGVDSLIHGLYWAMLNIEYSFMSYRFPHLSMFLVFIRVTRSAVSRIFSGYLCWSCIPFLNKPRYFTVNWTVRIAITFLPWSVVIRGLVYSPIRSRY